MASNFFDTNSYYVDEKVNVLHFNNIYKIYNDRGEIIGSIVQKLTSGQKLQRVVFDKSNLPFYLEIRNAQDEIEAIISRGWTFIMSRILIQDAKGNLTGTIQQKFHFLKPAFQILDRSDAIIANITGNWRARNFIIKNPFDIQIATVTKKWAGLAQEMFTTADKYLVTIDPKYATNQYKITILASAISIDMIYKSGTYHAR